MKQVYVKEYTRDDGTKVRSHYRNIEETVSRLSQGDNQGALDMISQTLATLPDEQNALAKVVAGNTIVPEEYNGYLGQLQDLNQFQNLAMKYKMLSDNELDVSEAADEIQNAFGEKILGGAAQINALSPTHNEGFKELPLIDKAKINWKMNPIANSLAPLTTKGIDNLTKNLNSAINDPNAEVVVGINKFKNEEFRNTLKKIGVHDEDMGVIYRPDSEASRTMAKSATVEKFVTDNFEDIKQGKIKTSQLNFQYSDNYLSLKQFDLQAAYQNVTIYEPKIVGNTINFMVIDRNDYTKQNGSGFLIKNNNEMAELQQKGAVKPYFTIMEVSVDLKKLKKGTK